ncbi:MAG: apolipoprotein N-acyltransferase [Rickettsiales bacterium]|jgi:apolipoprotein N-acyltransferase|nr:apolipoprotein N-acyltransferase [Rickettsiales bacterium]
MTKVLVQTHDKRWNKIKLDYENIVNAALPKNNAEVSILLTNDKEIQALNKKYRGMDKPTNVLSFETGDPEIMGDIVLSYDTIMKEAGAKKFKSHATHMIVHGALHLTGMDHIKDIDAETMEAREAKILSKIKWEKWIKRGALIALGAAATLGFAPNYLWFITIAALGAAYKIAKGYKDGFWFGTGYAAAGLSWMVESFFVDETAAAVFGWLAPVALVGIAIGGGIIFGLPFALTAAIKDDGWRKPFYFAAFWALVLWLRGWLFSGFPWNPLAGILADSVFANIVGIIGIIGTSFLIAGISAALASKKLIPILFFAAAFASAGIFSAARIGGYAINSKTNEAKKIVRIVQPAIPQKYKSYRANMMEENLRIVLALSDLPGEFDFIVWPESAYPYLVNEFGRMNFSFAKPLVFGGLRRGSEGYYNSMFVMENGEITAHYDKRHLVPFGEYSPLGPLVPVPGIFQFGGNAQGTMECGKTSFAPSICYEIIFHDLPRGAEYADMIINITNDGWFGKSIGPHQHLAMARLRAIESGMPVVRANYSGISAVINPIGEITAQLPIGERGVIDAPVPLKMKAAAPNPNAAIIIILLIALTLRLTARRGERKKD